MTDTTSQGRRQGIKPVWCPGCGNYAVLNALQKVFEELGLAGHETVMISGIGCSGRISHYLNVYALHGTHGRALPTAAGVKAARPELTVFAAGGDGDGFAIGGNHIMHAARRNADITYLVMDNNVFGLTKGQMSPTTPEGRKTKTSPYGSIDQKLEILPVLLAYDVSFIARTSSLDVRQLQNMISAAVKHRGFSIVHILSPCVTYPVLTWEWVKNNTETLPENFDCTNKMQAFEYAYKEEKYFTGFFYKKEKATMFDKARALELELKNKWGSKSDREKLQEILKGFS